MIKALLVLAALVLSGIAVKADPPPVPDVCLIDMAWISEPVLCCHDHVDNDRDGLTDMQDPDCR